jgi:hypothetical protein
MERKREKRERERITGPYRGRISEKKKKRSQKHRLEPCALEMESEPMVSGDL